jgi:plasmid stabilization system protein ParE
VREAGDEVARRFQKALDSKLRLLCEQPGLGRIRRFRHPKLQGLRSLAVERPFQRFLIFYRHDGARLEAVRLMDGARDLPRRLAQPPGSETI